MIKRPKKPEEIILLTKVSTKYKDLHTFTQYTRQTDTNTYTQDMPQNEINCIQIVKLISADFGSV